MSTLRCLVIETTSWHTGAEDKDSDFHHSQEAARPEAQGVLYPRCRGGRRRGRASRSLRMKWCLDIEGSGPEPAGHQPENQPEE